MPKPDTQEKKEMKNFFLGLALLFGLSTTQVSAKDEALEVWISPTINFRLDDNTPAKIETSQRFRNSRDKRPDTYFVRGWVGQRLNDNMLIEAGVEKRINHGADDEIRLLQQVTTNFGIIRNRVRLEQRFVENATQTSWRIRAKQGVLIPLDDKDKWSLKSDSEFFFVLVPTKQGGQTGFTENRTQVNFVRRMNDHFSFSFGYMRVQKINKSKQDSVGHVPTFTFDYTF